MPAIVLLSGGLDSAVNLKRAADDTGVALALTFDYAQRAADREVAAAALMCRALDISHRVIELPWLADISASALTRPESGIPEVSPEALEEGRVTGGATAEAVWVPNRNGIFVNIAAAFAEGLGADTIVAGFNAEEAATFPDNSPEFVAAANRALEFSALRAPRLVSYTQDLAKADIVRLGREIGAPLSCVWSCYRGEQDQCWRCESCARLERALREAGAWEWFRSQRASPGR
jgi:7-cyano-7-deazaguanine synthase